MRQLSLLYTANQQCYSIKYSPFDSSLLACVSCDKFGMAGSASLYMIKYQESAFLASKLSIIESFKSNSSLFEVDWSPTEPNLLLTANGDGSISIWRWPFNNNKTSGDDKTMAAATTTPSATTLQEYRKPVYNQLQHKKETHSVQW